MVQQSLLNQIIEKLNKAGLEYMVTGSMASNYYGNPRLTHDIDIVIQIYSSDVEIVVRLFEDDYYISKEAVTQALEHQGMFNVIDSQSGLKVDFWMLKPTPFHQESFRRKISVDVFGQKAWMISAEDLIIAKKLWAKQSGSESKQGMDIQGIEQVQGERLDRTYIRKWQLALGIE
jgi:hypothetical protein